MVEKRKGFEVEDTQGAEHVNRCKRVSIGRASKRIVVVVLPLGLVGVLYQRPGPRKCLGWD